MGDKLRRILKFSSIPLTPEAELLLFNASRAELVRRVIVPALKNGHVVICDRFTDSTVAYQGYGRGLNLSSIESIVEHCINPYAPDLTIFLNISPETVAVRLEQRQKQTKKNRLDLESLNFFKLTAQGFKALSAAEPERYVCLDGEQKIEVIHHEIVAVLKKRFHFQDLN